MVAKRFKVRLAIIYVLLSVMVWYVGQAQREFFFSETTKAEVQIAKMSYS